MVKISFVGEVCGKFKLSVRSSVIMNVITLRYCRGQCNTGFLDLYSGRSEMTLKTSTD